MLLFKTAQEAFEFRAARLARGLVLSASVTPITGSRYRVASASRDLAHIVAWDNKACPCEDFRRSNEDEQLNTVWCKHLYAVEQFLKEKSE